MGDYRERIAEVQHGIWSHWMRYLFSVCGELNDDGSATIPAYNVERWHRQMATGYADLTDKERESDRNQADKVLAERDAEIERLRAQVAELEAQLSKRAEQQARMWEVFRGMASAYHAIRTNTDLQFTYYMTQLDEARD